MRSIHLIVVLPILVGSTLFKIGQSCRFKSGRDDIWQDCSSNKCGSIDREQFVIVAK